MERAVPAIKAILLGDCGTGKTCLVKRFLRGTFDANEEGTVGAAFEEWGFDTPEGERVRFNFWDTAGQEQYRAIVPSYCQNAGIAFLCYAIDSRASFDSLDFWRGVVLDKAPDARTVMVATKLDLRAALPEPAVPEGEAHEKAFAFQTVIVQTSAKSGEGIAELQAFLRDLPRVLAPDVERPPVERPRRACC